VTCQRGTPRNDDQRKNAGKIKKEPPKT